MIESYSFGRIVVEGKSYSNDIKIIDDEVKPEWWRKSGHTVVAEDVADLAASGADYVVLGKGSPGNMQTVSEVRELFKAGGMQLIEEKTSRAIETYNRLRNEGKTVCAGFHLTC